MNARGLGQTEKRQDVLAWLKAKNFSIYCIVDFHCKLSLYKQYGKEWGSDGFFSEGTGDSRGVAILFNKNVECEVLGKDIDDEGNFVILDMVLYNHRFTLAAVYGPNRDKPGFYQTICEKIKKMENSSVMICGDFNLVMDYSLDTKGYQHQNNPKARDSVLQMMESLELFDVWRARNADNTKFTWFKNTKQMARLDYFLITSDWLTRTLQAKIAPGYRTDHSIVSLKLNCENLTRGHGFWKFNASLLHDKYYVNLVKEVIKETVRKYSIFESEHENTIVKYSIDDQSLFEMLKLEIRAKTISYCSHKKKLNEAQERKLEQDIESLYDKICNVEGNVSECSKMLEEKQAELENLRAVKMKAAMLRARVKHYELGEKPTKYFFELEKRNGMAKTISQLIVDDKIVKDQNEILIEQREYYKRLYSEKETNTRDFHTFVEECHINKLSDVQKSSCEGEITLDEVTKILSQMSNNKSPGSDGYTVEFYKFFFNDIGKYLIGSLNYAFKAGKLSVTQRLGVITCIPKANKCRERLSNWRPISLLNTDYKVLSGILSNRVKPVLCDIISEDQKGFLKNRCISENCRLLYDLMLELQRRNKPGLLLLVDFEKAFDSLSWSYISKILEIYNFGPDFLKWFKILYNDASSVVINGGHFSEAFKLGCGCRQGDPLSPYIFLLAIEPLAMKIKMSSRIKGIKIGTREHKLGQFADDLFLLQDGSASSLETTFDMFHEFQHISGLKVNVEKTHAVWLGSKIGSYDTVSNRIRLKWTDKFVLLGIHFDVNLNTMLDNNYNLVLGKMQNVLQLYQCMPLSLEGRVTVIKSLLIPKLIHVIQVLPLPKKKYVDQMNTLIRNFLWKNGKSRIALKVLCKKYDECGLAVTDINILNDAIKISWIKRLKMSGSDGGFQSLFAHNLSHVHDIVWNMDEDSLKDIAKNLENPFWREVISAWIKYCRTCKVQERNILTYPIWGTFMKNHNVLHRREEFLSKGIVYVNDLVSPSGGFMSHTDFKVRYNVNINFLDYNCMIHSLPIPWRKEVKKAERKHHIENVMLNDILSKDKVCNHVYNKMLNAESVNEHRMAKWSEILCCSIQETSWKYYFIMLRKAAVCSSLRSFQYLILQHALVTNVFLHKCNIKDADTCYFCGTQPETIDHLFYDCVHIRDLWWDITNILLPYVDLSNHINKKNILLGTENANELLINHLFIIIKRYIYVQRCKERTISIQGVIRFIKQYYDMDSNLSGRTDMWLPVEQLFDAG